VGVLFSELGIQAWPRARRRGSAMSRELRERSDKALVFELQALGEEFQCAAIGYRDAALWRALPFLVAGSASIVMRRPFNSL
jgi:hypothetical protein